MADDPTGANLPVPQRGGMGGMMGGARPHLEVRAGPEKGQSFRVAPGITVIGRSPTCDIVLTEEAVSRQHCRIERSGDQWILRNLSSNGTRIKRKAIEEHVLSDGDEIRIGLKTRLVFVIEEVTRSTESRAQFRPRTGLPAGEEPEGGDEAEPDEEEREPSLFQKRKTLFIGLGVYFSLMVIAGLVAAIYLKGGKRDGTRGDEGIPWLSVESQIRPAGWATPLPVDRSTPAGVWCVSPLGDQILVPHIDLETGKARWVPGIRQAIDVEYVTREEKERRVRAGELPPSYPYVLASPRSRNLAKQCKTLAIENYLVSDMPGNEPKLLHAVRLFQQALAHYGMRFLPNHSEDKMRQEAIKRLIDKIQTLYNRARLQQGAGDDRAAITTFERLLKYVPEPHNLIYRNVSAHLSALKEKVKKESRASR